MTRDEILAMPAGREMDALVAEKIFGLKTYWREEVVRERGITNRQETAVIKTLCVVSRTALFVQAYYYSTNIAAAWEVVERNRGEAFTLLKSPIHGGYFASFVHKDEESVFAHTAPLAICRAALLTVIGNE